MRNFLRWTDKQVLGVLLFLAVGVALFWAWRLWG